jgi:hypothetical protein
MNQVRASNVLVQAQGADGRQARALGQDAAGRRYYRLGGDAGATRVFVDAAPSAAQMAAGGGGAASAAATGVAAADDTAVALQRATSVASGVHADDPARGQQPSMPSSDQLLARLQQRAQHQQQQRQRQRQQEGPGRLAAGPDDTAWGWYEVDQLPALLEWLEGGNDSERALADAVFEATLQLLPAPNAHTAPSQACLF